MSLPPLKQHWLGGDRGLEKKSLWWLVVLRLGPWQAARVWQEGLSLESHHRVWDREVECLFCENLAPEQIFFSGLFQPEGGTRLLFSGSQDILWGVILVIFI